MLKNISHELGTSVDKVTSSKVSVCSSRFKKVVFPKEGTLQIGTGVSVDKVAEVIGINKAAASANLSAAEAKEIEKWNILMRGSPIEQVKLMLEDDKVCKLFLNISQCFSQKDTGLGEA